MLRFGSTTASAASRFPASSRHRDHTDSFFAGGHPGYPQDGAIFAGNKLYSNTFNSFADGSDVEPRVPVPVGTGLFIAGGNGNEIRGNRIWRPPSPAPPSSWRGAGGDDAPQRTAAHTSGPLGPDARLQTATCREWRAAPAHQRRNTVDRLEEVAAAPRDSGRSEEVAREH